MTFPPAPAPAPAPAAIAPADARAAAVPPDQPFRSGTPRAGQAETQRLLADGLIRNVLADVFVARDAPDSLQLRALSATLLVPPERRRQQAWVVGFMSAAWLYTGRWPQLEPGSQGQQPPRLDVIIGAGRNRPLDPWIRARQGHLAGNDIVLVHGLPVSDPVRTAADICRELTARPALELVRWLGELNQVTPEQVLRQLAGMRYARGAARARAIVGAWQHQG